jgi:hypothetical protein
MSDLDGFFGTTQEREMVIRYATWNVGNLYMSDSLKTAGKGKVVVVLK